MMAGYAKGAVQMEAPVFRENFAVRGYDVLKRDIIRGLFKPGEKLLMSGLKERYGLGVGPLREALSQLVAERLVVAISQRGYRVAPMSLSELADIYDARANLEAMLLTLAIERGDDSWEAAILARAHTLGKVVEVRNAEEMLSLWDAPHKAFHEAIVAGGGPPPPFSGGGAPVGHGAGSCPLWVAAPGVFRHGF